MKGRLKVIDGLRGLAILAVIFQHAYAGTVAQFLSGVGLPPALVLYGWLGVGLFFVLSGFVLALPYFEDDRHVTVRDFFKRRALRLFPMFAVSATAALLLGGISNLALVRSYLLTLSTLNMFDWNEFVPQINPPLWSISVEIWFSILFPALLLLIAKYGHWRVLLTTLIVALIVRLLGANLTHQFFSINPVTDSVLGRIDDFVIGIVLARLYADGRFKTFSSWVACLGLCLVVVAAWGWNNVLTGTLIWPLKPFLNLSASMGFALIIAASLADRNIMATILTPWPLRLAGAMCYSLYCWHYIVIRDTAIISDPAGIRANAIFWGITIGLSILTYGFIEFPNRDWRALLLMKSIRRSAI